MRVAATRAAVLLIVVGWTAMSWCAGAGARARHPSELERVLGRMTEAIGAPGAVLMLDDGRRVRRVAVGVANRRSRTPMPRGGRFRVHSMTKTFTAAVVLQLAAEGRLSLDDTVDRWLAGRLTGANGITVRQLLNHTSGVYDAGGRGPVGTYWYANTNYELLGALVESVTGAPLAAEIERRIIAPLRLRHTSWPTRRSVRGLVRGYELAGGDEATLVDPSTLTGAAAIVSTALDLRRFLRGLFGGALLPPRERAAMLTPVAVNVHSRALHDGYGLGLMRHRTACGTVWGHRGRAAGYTTIAYASPDGRRSVIALFNAGAAIDSSTIYAQRLMFRVYCR
jgi:D-alanyl-D-alanine carboxypeptidase